MGFEAGVPDEIGLAAHNGTDDCHTSIPWRDPYSFSTRATLIVNCGLYSLLLLLALVLAPCWHSRRPLSGSRILHTFFMLGFAVGRVAWAAFLLAAAFLLDDHVHADHLKQRRAFAGQAPQQTVDQPLPGARPPVALGLFDGQRYGRMVRNG